MASKAKNAKVTKVSLIATDDKSVKVPVKPGQTLEVVQVETITPDLKKAGRVGARLCGYGTNICLALIDTSQ